MNSYLKHLIEDPLVYYVYQSDLSIYGIPSSEEKYIVVVDKSYKVPDDFKDSVKKDYEWQPIKFKVEHENTKFKFYEMQEWFGMILKNDTLVWQCSCLKPAFVKKSCVKITLSSDLLQHRKDFDAVFDPYMINASIDLQQDAYDQAKLRLLEVLKTAEFINQIIEFHKIVNYTRIKEFYNKLNACENTFDSIMNTFFELSKDIIKPLLDKTDPILKKEKLKKIKTNE